ncbi:heavy metal translocating P-type ATPase [Thermanaerovibrio velox DSM 12556]|uniref:Heavy metal translocating P-type ATPase n=1 Tax=Thermanaerovibrio velox DSM 12556 TaxID=926567 RepID=H0USM3_9BACT|nr:heavy metal translocating P-type ATPase [Thermanaerovibrio velox]EHM10312.1 heavy metal translocating P-type ATPase [Thermanaerovibrio velox DSM 12556]
MSDLELTKRTYRVSGMTCATCARMLQKGLSKVQGVSFVSVDLATETALVICGKEVSEEALLAAAERAGYPMVPFSEAPDSRENQRYRASVMNLAIAAVLSTPVWFNMAYHMFLHRHAPLGPLVEAVLAFLAVFAGGRSIFRSAWIALSHRHANMDVLIGIGAAAGSFTGFLNVVSPEVPSFAAVGTMMVVLHLTGRFIESRLRDRALKKVRSLMDMKPRMARVLEEGREELVPEEFLKVGQVVRVLPGERIPVDGLIIDGVSSVDESFITGESDLPTRGAGDPVVSGSLNLTGPLIIRADKVGDESFVSRMLQMVRESQGARTPIQALADRITMYFVPVVISLAVLSGVLWLAMEGPMEFIRGFVLSSLGLNITRTAWPWLYASMATLVIACPCALGLATPMALAVAAGEASSCGVLIRDGEAFQELKSVGAVVLDKTGTLTMGRPAVVRCHLPDWALGSLLSIESSSSHPIAKAVVAHISSSFAVERVEVDDLREVPGEGIFGVIAGEDWFVGRPSDSKWTSWAQDGLTVVEVRKGGEVLGALGLRDPLREDSLEALRALKERGVEVIMATGDSEEVAMRVAKETGIGSWRGRMKPEDKLALVHSLQSKGLKVAMVGDGINDAASLKGANVGIAMGSGLDLAIDSADLVLVRPGLSGVVRAFDISRGLSRVIAQNLAGAFGYNLVFIPLAMLGVMHPMLAELAMLCSSITVIINSLRIRSRE